jgi:hypothetical protein
MKRIISYASLLTAAAVTLCSFSCSKVEPDDEVTTTEDITLSVDKDVIKCDGNDAATFTVKADDGTVIKEGVTFFDADMNELDIKDFRFTTTEAGEYTFWAAYKTFNSDSKNPVRVRAINATAPSIVADPKPESKSFVRRVFISQFTGTGCGFCPSMVYIMKNAFAKNNLDGKYVLAASHSYNTNDPAYISSPNAGNFGGTGYPYLALDMAVGYGDYTSESKFTQIFNARYNAEQAKVGISANPVYENDRLVVRVSVKAAETGNYNLGVWFLQDNVYGMQTDKLGITTGDDSYNKHNNCVRLADSRYMGSYAGYPLGEIEAGKTAERTFVLNVNTKRWKLTDLNDLHFAAFVTTLEGRAYKVVNVIDCPYNEPVTFDYAE